MSDGVGWGAWERGNRFFRGLRVRIAATLGLAVGGMIWLIGYAAFWAGRFAWYQNLAVILSTLIAVPTIVIGMWVLWGIRAHRYFWDDDRLEPR